MYNYCYLFDAPSCSGFLRELWFTDEDKEVSRLKNLVSYGQFTSCYNLSKYCIGLKKSGSAVDNAWLDQIIGIFHADWRKFIQDPYWLHDIIQNPA